MLVAEVHPSAEELAAFTLGNLGDDANASVEAHVAACTACQELAAAVAGDRLVELLRSAHVGTVRKAETVCDAAEGQTPAPLAVGSAAVTITPASPPLPAEEAPEAVPPELAGHERYRVARLLGEGGMGAVYEAEHRVMHRPVALKVINRAYTTNAAAVERFRREVRAAARLAHPNIVATYDAEDAGDRQFLVMEFVKGISLGRRVKERGPLPVREACDYVRQAALGLQHAHECGMVHRDVKPDNLILVAGPDASTPGVVKVLDFGLAALTAERGDGLTDTNVVMGTPDYMAPEQAEDPRTADIRADVYSLGCTLYYLLTGSVPYPAPTPLLKLLAHREKPVPSVRGARPEVPTDLAAVLERLLAKRPADRYQTPGEAAAALEPFTRPPAEPTRKRRPLLVAALAAMFGGLLLAGVVVYRVQTDKGELVITTASDDVEVVVKQGGKVIDIIDTKTNKSLRLRSGVYDLELKGAPAGLKLDITSATLLRGKIVVAKIERRPRTPPQPKPQTPLTPLQPVTTAIQLLHRMPRSRLANIRDVAVSRDGQLFATWVGGRRNEVVVWDGKTGKERYRKADWLSNFTPDGKRLVVGKYGQGDDTLDVYEAATGKFLRTISFDAGVWACGVLPDSRHVVVSTHRREAHVCDLNSGRIVHSWKWDGAIPYTFTDDGSIIFIKPARAEKYYAWDVQQNRASAEFGHLVKYPSFNLLPGNKQAIVPAAEVGKWLVLDVADGKLTPFPDRTWPPNVIRTSALLDVRINLIGNADGRLCTFDYLTGRETAALQLPDRETLRKGDLIALSPEGRYACVQTARSIYFLRLVERIANRPPDKAREVRRLLVAGTPLRVQLSPDGQKLLATTDANRGWMWEVASGKLLYEVQGWGAWCQWDRQRLMTTSGPAGGNKLRLYDSTNGKLLKEVRNSAPLSDYEYGFSPDGKLAFASGADGVLRLWDLETGRERRHWQRPVVGAFFMHDGRHIILTVAKPPYRVWDLEADQEVKKFQELARFPVSKLLPERNQFISFNRQEVLIRDMTTGKVVASQAFDPMVLAAWWRFSGDGRRFIVGLKETVRIYRVADGKELARFAADQCDRPALAMSADGRFATTGTRDGELIVWYIP